MLKLIMAGAIAIPTVTTATVAATGIAWVDVRDGNDRIVVPVPLLVAEVAASFLPKPAIRNQMGEAVWPTAPTRSSCASKIATSRSW